METIEKISAFLFTGLAVSWFIGAALVLSHLEEVVRIMKGRPDAPHMSQREDYVQIRSGGQVVLRNGTRVKDTEKGIKPSAAEEAHIPYKEWEKWKEWDNP